MPDEMERTPAQLKLRVAELERVVKAMLLAFGVAEAELDENLMAKGDYLGIKFD